MGALSSLAFVLLVVLGFLGSGHDGASVVVQTAVVVVGGVIVVGGAGVRLGLDRDFVVVVLRSVRCGRSTVASYSEAISQSGSNEAF